MSGRQSARRIDEEAIPYEAGWVPGLLEQDMLIEHYIQYLKNHQSQSETKILRIQLQNAPLKPELKNRLCNKQHLSGDQKKF